MNGWLHAAGAAGLAAPVTQFWSNMSDQVASARRLMRRREPDMANDASRQARTALVTGGGCLGRAASPSRCMMPATRSW